MLEVTPEAAQMRDGVPTAARGVTAGTFPEDTENKTGTGTTRAMSATGIVLVGVQTGGMMDTERLTAPGTSESVRRNRTRRQSRSLWPRWRPPCRPARWMKTS